MIVALALVMALALPAWADSASDLRTLAEEGDAKAQFVLGTLYRDGQGVEKDLAETLRWWTKAAELGNVDAQFALGNIYSGGFGVTRDYVQSYMWFDITAAQTETVWLAPIARSNRDALVNRMTDAEVSEAKRMSADWIARHMK
jgi:hypothetical protein